jgi:hypothetical protein
MLYFNLKDDRRDRLVYPAHTHRLWVCIYPSYISMGLSYTPIVSFTYVSRLPPPPPPAPPAHPARIYLSIHLSPPIINPSIHPSIYQHLSIHPSIHPSISTQRWRTPRESIYLYPSIHLPISSSLSIHPSIHPSIYIFLSFFPSTYINTALAHPARISAKSMLPEPSSSMRAKSSWICASCSCGPEAGMVKLARVNLVKN